MRRQRAGRRAPGQRRAYPVLSSALALFLLSSLCLCGENSSSSRVVRLTRDGGFKQHPPWSPDGKRLAFASARAGNFEIHVMDAGGGNVRRLTRNAALDYWPAWSPDGKRLAFTSNRDGNYEIYVMNADGSGQRNLTRHPASDNYAAWSPDGRRLAFISNRGGGYNIYVMDVP